MLRIAIVSTPFIRVPPVGYGGTELFCYELAEGLTSRGHDVTLFTTGDSTVSCRRRALYVRGSWPPTPEDELNHVAWAVGECAREEFDVIHLSSAVGIPIARLIHAVVVHTIHHCRSDPHSRIYARHPEVTYVALSERQRGLEVPLPRARVIHHGLTPARYPLSLSDEGYLAHIGRYAAEKGTHVAIDVARGAGLPLRLAGRVHPMDQPYFDEEVAPRLRATGTADLGEADHAQKVAILRGARAILCPLQWEEPFGLIAIEAMLCGTPVLGFRRGAFPEIVDEGVTGYLADGGDVERLIALARSLDSSEDRRSACARRARERFSTTGMVSRYEAAYRAAIGSEGAVRQRAA